MSVAIIYLCLFIDAADSSMLGVFYNYWTLYVTLLNDSLSDYALQGSVLKSRSWWPTTCCYWEVG